ncbi:MAG: hypothetical protein HYS15_00550 [Candidatus Spechtbacteria bacterium]|nr:hypothetical protein [Candidatus Spechtbacteria bacterium]
MITVLSTAKLKMNGIRRYFFYGIALFGFFLVFPAYARAESFFVNKSFDTQNREAVEGALELAGENAYFFVEKGYRDALPAVERSRLDQKITELSREFDSRIYVRMREVFGEERNPGIDNDSKITIFLHLTKGGVGGYVRDSDEYSRKEDAASNEREMVYLNIEEIINGDFGPSFLAHEFQHLITFNQKTVLRGVREDQWLNEARSEYAPTLLGYNEKYDQSYLKKRVDEFLAHPSDALLDFRGRSIDHASVSLFMHYLIDRYGITILKEMMRAPATGMESINVALQALSRNETFRDVFGDWMVTVYVNGGVNSESERFRYRDPNLSFGNLHVLPSGTFRVYDNYLSGANFAIDNWSGQWYRFVPGSLGEETALHIRFRSAESKDLSVPYIVSDFFGGIEVKNFNMGSGSILTVPKFGNGVSSVVLAPSLTIPGTNFAAVGNFSLEGFLSDTSSTRFADGALVRAEGDSKVYIVKNGTSVGSLFKRWIQTPELFGFYHHFSWNDVIEVKQQFLSGFKESFLIRKAGDYRVYEVDKLGRKKWLNMTPAAFEKTGHSWDQIYEVNDAEFAWYRGF